MRRRAFMTTVASALTMPLAGLRAQGKRDPRRVAILMGSAPTLNDIEARLAALRQELSKLGWNEGQNLQLDIRHAEGEPLRMRGQAKELLALKPDLVIAHSPQVLEVVRAAAGTAPIVFVQVPFPVEMGFVKSLSHPGANITGVTIFEADIAGKWLEILTEIAPRTERVLVLHNSTNNSHRQFNAVLSTTARRRRVALTHVDVTTMDQVEPKLAAFAAQPGGAVLLLPDLSTSVNRHRLRSPIERHRLPAIFPFRYFAEEGGLVSYSPELKWMWSKAAFYVDRILRGTHPSELPVEAPNVFTLIINLKAAAALSIEVPPMMLARADEVIE